MCYMAMGIIGTEIEKENRNRIKKKETCSNEEPTSTFVLSSHDRLSSSSAFFRVVVVHRGTWAGTKKWRQVCRKSLNRNLSLGEKKPKRTPLEQSMTLRVESMRCNVMRGRERGGTVLLGSGPGMLKNSERAKVLMIVMMSSIDACCI